MGQPGLAHASATARDPNEVTYLDSASERTRNSTSFRSDIGGPRESNSSPRNDDNNSRESTYDQSHRHIFRNEFGYGIGLGYESDKEHIGRGDPLHVEDRIGPYAIYYDNNSIQGGGRFPYGPAHDKLTLRKFMAFVSLSFMFTSSQIPIYLFGAIAPEIYAVLGGVDRWIWFVLGNLLALASICPFVGALSDLVGRRYLALAGFALVIIGMIICSTAKSMNPFIGGMTIAGAGAGINELTSISGTSELAPVNQRGKYVALLVLSILPWSPSAVWAQLITSASNFRYVGLLAGLWAFVGFMLTLLFYFPPPRPNSRDLSRREVLARIDYVGGFLSISGLVLFMMGLEWGGYQYNWGSAHVLAPLILGIFLLIAFAVWEIYGARNPMVPWRLGENPRVLILTLVITFISGANFFSLLFFWPTQAFNMYNNDPIQVGIRTLPLGFGVLGGAVIVTYLIGLTGRARLLLFLSSALMTAGTGACSIATPTNLPTMYGLVFLASLGIGGIVIPAQVITTLVCPADLIATITALTLSLRVIGGAVGFTVYYSVFYHKLVPALTQVVGVDALVHQLGLADRALIARMVRLAANAQFAELRAAVAQSRQTTPYFFNVVVTATQWAFADAYKWVYWVSVAFGGVAVVCSLFVGDVEAYLEDGSVSVEYY